MTVVKEGNLWKKNKGCKTKSQQVNTEGQWDIMQDTALLCTICRYTDASRG